MKQQIYQTPVMEIFAIENCDVLTTSDDYDDRTEWD